MRKTTVALLVLLVLLSVYMQFFAYHMTGVCDAGKYIPLFSEDIFEGKRPTDKLNSTWVCEEEDSYFTVIEDENGKPVVLGEINNFKTQMISVEFKFEAGSSNRVNAYVEIQEGLILRGFTGTCMFGSDYVLIRIDTDTDGIFRGCVDRMLFKKSKRT